MLFTWRRQLGAGDASGGQPVSFVPATITTEASGAPCSGGRDRIEIVLASGARDRRHGRGRSALARVIKVLSGSDDPGFGRRAGMACGRAYGYAPRDERSRSPGAGGNEARSHAGDLYVFRGRRGNLLKIIWHDGVGMSLYAKRLEHGKFIWPSPANGAVAISAAQLAYMLDGSTGETRVSLGARSRQAEAKKFIAVDDRSPRSADFVILYWCREHRTVRHPGRA